MAEINDLGNIQNGVEHISEVLDSMRAQNAMNAGDMDKVLANINSRLETLSNDENSDLIKVFLTELKRSLDERHNFVSSKFGEIENSFKNLVENAGQEIQRQAYECQSAEITRRNNGRQFSRGRYGGDRRITFIYTGPKRLPGYWQPLWLLRAVDQPTLVQLAVLAYLSDF